MVDVQDNKSLVRWCVSGNGGKEMCEVGDGKIKEKKKGRKFKKLSTHTNYVIDFETPSVYISKYPYLMRQNAHNSEFEALF